MTHFLWSERHNMSEGMNIGKTCCVTKDCRNPHFYCSIFEVETEHMYIICISEDITVEILASTTAGVFWQSFALMRHLTTSKASFINRPHATQTHNNILIQTTFSPKWFCKARFCDCTPSCFVLCRNCSEARCINILTLPCPDWICFTQTRSAKPTYNLHHSAGCKYTNTSPRTRIHCRWTR